MDDARCGNCVFLDARNPNDIFCRRYPPVLVTVREKARGDVVRAFYPSVSPVHDWCGEHRKPS